MVRPTKKSHFLACKR